MLSRIGESPARFPLLFEPDIRSAKVKRFPYRVVYVVVENDSDRHCPCEAATSVLAPTTNMNASGGSDS